MTKYGCEISVLHPQGYSSVHISYRYKATPEEALRETLNDFLDKMTGIIRHVTVKLTTKTEKGRGCSILYRYSHEEYKKMKQWFMFWTVEEKENEDVEIR